MFIKTANFIGSFTKTEQAPEADKPEYAFIGRSNVGKSSLINMITNHKGLAKVSQTPGKTQHLNYFLMNDSWYLVDLPGYGFAKASKSSRKDWDQMIRYYMRNRESLMCVFLLIDCRIPPQKVDLDFANWLGEEGVPFVIVFTKTDKPKQREVSANIKLFQKAMSEYWEELPPMFRTSSVKRTGQEEILEFIEQSNSGIE